MILQSQPFNRIDINVVVPMTKRFAPSVESSLQSSLASTTAQGSSLPISAYQYGAIPSAHNKPLYKESIMPRLPISPQSCFVPLKPCTDKASLSSTLLTPITARSSPAPSLGSLSSSTAVSENAFNVRNPPQNISFCQMIPRTPSRSQTLSSASPTPSSSSLSSSSYSTMSKRRPKSPRESGGDSVRRNKVKTELCMYYVNNNHCPYGEGCTYAHGEEELQLTKLMDLHRAGLADVETYRTKPCLTWVSTGSW